MIHMKNWGIRLICQILAGILGLYLANRFILNVQIDQDWTLMIWAGIAIGLLNFFIRPILMIIAIPIRILTFGFFSAIINMLMIWSVSFLYPTILIPWFWPLFWTSILIGLSATLISFVLT
jgi:putative membrane protein